MTTIFYTLKPICGYGILNSHLYRRHPVVETKGGLPIISPADLRRVEEIFWKHGLKALFQHPWPWV